MLGQFPRRSEDDARVWLDAQLVHVFPDADSLVQNMELDDSYEDVTFETLNQEPFLEAVKAAFPGVDWDKAYTEFRAVGETEK